MKILLIQPPRYNPQLSFAIGDQEPLGLETIAGMLPQHEIKLLDMRFDEQKIESMIEIFQPQVVGITGVTCEYYKVCAVLKKIKTISPNILTVVGGVHASLVPEDFNKQFVDIIVIGEGELTFKELIETYERKMDLANVDGLAICKNGKLNFTKKREVIKDLNSIPLPNRLLTKEYRNYYSRGTWQPMGSLYSTKGCPYKCTFCCTWILGDEKFRTRGIDIFMKDLAAIDEYYIFVSDDNTIHDTTYSKELCHAVKQTGIKKEYQFYGRADKIVKCPELIEEWRSIGLKRLLIGIEHITDERLKKVHKGTTRNINDEALKILRDLDIETIAYFLIEPDFEKKDFENISNYCMEMQISDPTFVFLNAYPGTSLYNDMKDSIIESSYEYLDMLHCPYKTKLPLETLYKYYFELYKEIYLDRLNKNTSYSLNQIRQLFFTFEKEYNIIKY